MNARRDTAHPLPSTIYRIVAYRPNGAIAEETTAGFGLLAAACGHIRSTFRNDRGWSPDIRVFDADGRDVTAWADR